MFWAKFDTRNALTSLSGTSLLQDGSLSCGKVRLSRPGIILIFIIFIFFMSGTGTEEVSQMHRRVAHPGTGPSS